MRNISTAGLATLAKKLGNEPICIVEIDWVAGSTSSYADRAVARFLVRSSNLATWMTPYTRKVIVATSRLP